MGKLNKAGLKQRAELIKVSLESGTDIEAIMNDPVCLSAINAMCQSIADERIKAGLDDADGNPIAGGA